MQNPCSDEINSGSRSGLPSTREMDRLEQIQQKATKMIKGLEHLTWQERLRELGSLSLDQRRFRRILSKYISTWQERVKKREPDLAQ